MSGRYARDTVVSVESSRAELLRILERYGAKEHGIMQREHSITVQFKMNALIVTFEFPIPDPTDKKWWVTPTGFSRTSQAEADRAYRQALMQRWRAVVLYAKAQLEAVEAGILSFEEAWLSHILAPGTDRTVGEIYIDEIRLKARAQAALPPGKKETA